jgi:Nuclease-related domain
MRLTRWQIAGASTFALLALLLILGGDYVSGPVLLAIVVLVVLGRVEIVEKQLAGSYDRARWRLGLAQTLVLLTIYVAVLGVFVFAAVQHWATLDARGRVAIWGLAGFAWLLYREMDRRGDEAINWLKGTRAEESVGARLDQLRSEGWEVVHNLKKDFGDNVDHVAWSERGAYAIETKSGRFRHRDLPQAIANAVWVKEKFGARWVTAVLCVTEDPPSHPRQYGYAWVLGPNDVQHWLRGRPIDGHGSGPKSIMVLPTGENETSRSSPRAGRT